ncbi:MAG: prolyl oligopeptidase family serine peptidase [Oscillochloris sp.]|nr:prolyl oligopeptidase family serine peptidase [Oscillochloris sp.]
MLIVLLLAVVLAGCAGATPAPTAVAPAPTTTIVPPSPTPEPGTTPEPTATTVPNPTPTATSSPTATPEPSPTVVPTPDPVAGLTIPDLRRIEYGVGEISINEVWIDGPNYTTYRISYPAGDLRVTGLIHIPDGPGPFTAIIANRGTIARDIYQPGMDSRAFADYMVRRGYLIVAPDFRGYAGGDDGPNPFYTGFYQDVLHLIPQVQRLSMVRPGPIGMWGHSRGASATIAALTISDQIAAAVVYAPAPADLVEDYWRRYRNSGGNPGTGTWIFTPDENPDAYARVSPITYFDAVNAPVMLHHGTADSTVDAAASVAIAEALRAAGKDVTLHLYDGGPHTLRGEQEALYLQRSYDFFGQHMGPP